VQWIFICKLFNRISRLEYFPKKIKIVLDRIVTEAWDCLIAHANKLIIVSVQIIGKMPTLFILYRADIPTKDALITYCRFTLKLQKWLGRKHVYLNFYLTPLLTGPGCFKHYLNRFKHERYPYCSLCDSVNKDAEHLFFVCTQFKNKRRDLSMLESEENWSAVCNIATIVAKKTAHRRKTA